jgi:ferrous iron transport protein B
MAVIFSATTAADTDLIGMAMDQDLLKYIGSGDFGSFLATTGLSQASALSFVFAVFFSLPCFGVLAAIYAETRSALISMGAFLYYFAMSLIMGGLAYLAGLMVF